MLKIICRMRPRVNQSAVLQRRAAALKANQQQHQQHIQQQENFCRATFPSSMAHQAYQSWFSLYCSNSFSKRPLVWLHGGIKTYAKAVPSATTDGRRRCKGNFNTTATAAGSCISGLEHHWEAGATGLLSQSGTTFVHTRFK